MQTMPKGLRWILCFAAAVLVTAVFPGFKLEKSARELTETQTVKAPTAEEENKVKEGAPSPSFKTESFDDFMTSGPIRKSSPPPASNKKAKTAY